MQPWQRIEPTQTHQIGRRTIVTKHFRQPDGSIERYDSFHPEGQRFASVIALTPKHEVIIARQFRFGPEAIMDEQPGGGIDADEEPATAARRELLEETGYEAGNMRLLGAICKDAYFNSVSYYFLATDCILSRTQQLESTEFIEVVLLSIDEFIQTAKIGRNSDAAGVLLAYDTLIRLKENAHV